MKIWEALEKYDRIKRAGWSDEENKHSFVKNTTDDRVYVALKIVDFFADDWERYEEPERTETPAEPNSEIAKLKTIIQNQNIRIAKIEKDLVKYYGYIKDQKIYDAYETYRFMQFIRERDCWDELRGSHHE